jgi:YggT family protein
MDILAELILKLAGIIRFLLIIYIIFSILISFNVINAYNQFVTIVYGSLYKLFEPMLRPIRNFLPDLGGIDFSPIVLLLAIEFGAKFIVRGLLSI